MESPAKSDMLPDYSDISVGLPSSISLLGKIAIITGGSRGIGSALALGLAARGADIAITYTSDNSTAKAENVTSKVRALGRKATIIKCDMERHDCGEVIVKETLQSLGDRNIDILVNNAALAEPGGPTAAEAGFTATAFDRIFRVNVRAPALLVKAILPHLPDKGGRIINISSVNARVNFPRYSLYSASKSALDSLTRTWAKELPVKYHCTVNGVIVGPTATPDAPDSPARDVAKSMMTAERRLGTMDDVVEVVGFLASEGSRWVNGDNIGCNGGSYIAS